MSAPKALRNARLFVAARLYHEAAAAILGSARRVGRSSIVVPLADIQALATAHTLALTAADQGDATEAGS
jgi:hypothetical protein